MRTGTAVRWLVIGVLLAVGGCNKSNPNSNSGNPAGGATANTPAGNSSAANPSASGAPAANTTPSQPAPPPPVVIDAGTLLTVTIDQTVSSKTNNNGDPFAASLAAPISVGGVTVLPTGTRAKGTVVQADSAGRVKGGAVLALTLDSLTVNGQPYSIQTRSSRRPSRAAANVPPSAPAAARRLAQSLEGWPVEGRAQRLARWRAAAQEPRALRSPENATSRFRLRRACILN